MEDYKFSIVPLWYREEILMFGFPLFGGWLPLIKFTSIAGHKGVLAEWFLRGVFFVWGEDE